MGNKKEVQGGIVVNIARANQYGRRKLKLKPYQLVFDPAPKQKWHKQLIALIPPMGHELDCPLEFEQFPYAKYEWLRIMELNKRLNVIHPCHREILYGYCLMVERRKRCILEWNGNEGYVKTGEMTASMDYLAFEIDRLTTDIEKLGTKLGLYPVMFSKSDTESTMKKKCSNKRKKLDDDIEYDENKQAEIEVIDDSGEVTDTDDLFD